MGKRNFEMGMSKTKQQALLLVGASGGIGSALLKYLSPRTSLTCLPTFNKNKPADSTFAWTHFNSLDFDSAGDVFYEILEKYEIQIVIDASGAFFASKLLKTTSEEIDRVISTNLVAPLLLAKYAQDFLSPGGKIVFMSSIVSSMSLVGSSAYAASKAGLERSIMALGPEFSESGHAICGIRLGYMDYGMTYKINEKTRMGLLENMSEKKFIEIGIVGDLILEIINSNFSNVNGKLYEID